MDQATVELLRTLQSDAHDDATLRQITALYREQRRALVAVDDQGMISQLGELLEGWAEGAPPEVASAALCEAAVSAEEDLEQPERAIRILERVLDLEPTSEALEQLARLYTKRGDAGDVAQAAELYAALGDTLGDAGKPWLERALNLAPTNEAALDSLEALIPVEDHPTALRDRWAAYLEHGGDARTSDAGPSDASTVTPGERRRLELSRAYAAAGSFRDALMCISPLAERGHSEAARLQEAYLTNLEGAVAPPKRGRMAESLPPPKHVRSARSGGTMVGFKLEEYHEALRREGKPIDGPSEQPSEQPAATATPASTPPAASPEEDSAVRPMPKANPPKTMLGLGAIPNLPNAPPAESVESEAPVRRSLPPPNPALVRASSPPHAPTRSSSSGQALAASPMAKTNPRPQLKVAPSPVAAPIAAQALEAPAPISAPVIASEPVVPAVQPSPFMAVALPAADELPTTRQVRPKNNALMWPIAIGVTLLIAGGAWLLSKEKPKSASEASTPTSVAPATPTPTAVAAAPVVPVPVPAAVPAPVAPTTATTAEAAAAPAAAEQVAARAPAPAIEEEEKGTIKPLTKEMRVKGGRISGAQMLIALEEALPKIEHCYGEALEDKPTLEGKATLGFSIQKTGKLAAPKIVQSTLKHAALEKCALNAIRNERFPKMKKVAKVTLPISFTP